jgi:hypothetical protein
MTYLDDVALGIGSEVTISELDNHMFNALRKLSLCRLVYP